MTTTGEHNGMIYTVPAADDGLWRWYVHSAKRLRKSQLQKIAVVNAPPRSEYTSLALAIQAAKAAINQFVG
jgi:hypothetical protein